MEKEGVHMSKAKSLILTGFFIALGIVLPMAFHGIPYGGQIFSPMHIPVLLSGLVLGPVFGLICGVLTPFLSSTLTGMPPATFLPAMTVELGAFGLVGGLLMRYLPIRHYVPATYLSLIGAMLTGRIVAGIANALIFQLGNYSLQIWVTSHFVRSLPGIVLHIVVVPLVYFALRRAGLVHTSI